MTPPPIVTKRRLKRIAPLQLGKMLGILYGLLGLIFIPFFLLSALFSSGLPGDQRVGVMAFGVGFAIFMPVIYGVMGFISGVIGAALYNLVSGWIGGIEVEVE